MDVKIEFATEEFILLAEMAHEKDITLNELVNNLLRNEINKNEAIGVFDKVIESLPKSNKYKKTDEVIDNLVNELETEEKDLLNECKCNKDDYDEILEEGD